MAYAISDQHLEDEDWEADEYGRIVSTRTKRAVFKVGFIAALRKVLQDSGCGLRADSAHLVNGRIGRRLAADLTARMSAVLCYCRPLGIPMKVGSGSGV